MNFSTPLLAALVGLMCFLLAWPIANYSPFYRCALAHTEVGRTPMLDGLRGWLALGVLLTHAANMYSYFANGSWTSSYAPIYARLGPAGVCLFFMVTAFLFWGRVLRSDARLDVRRFLVSRVRRIVPMYLVSVGFVLLVIAVASGFRLHVSPPTLIKQIRPWLTFGLMAYGDVNGLKGAHYIDSAYWTLAFEWLFYLALPLLALYHRGWKFALLLSVAAFFVTSTPVLFCFIFGMLAAWIVEGGSLRFPWRSRWLTPLPLAVLLLALAYPDTYAFLPELLLFVFFLFVVNDNSLFGLLATRAAKLLGTVSYSIYVLHCIVLFAVVSLANAVWPIKTMPLEIYGSLVISVALITVLISTATYRHIEHPFLLKHDAPEPGHDIGAQRAPLIAKG